MPVQKSLATAVAEIKEWLDNGEDENDLELVVLPPDRVDELSDEEEIDENVTKYGTDAIPQDTVGFLEAGPRGGTGAECETRSKSTSTKSKSTSTESKIASKPKPRKWSKRVSYNSAISDKDPEPLYRSNPELCEMSPYDIFSLYFDQAVVDLIIEQSNVYANRDKNNPQFSLDASKLMRFIGIHILSGYHRLPNEKFYWSKDPDMQVRIVEKPCQRMIL